MSDKGYFVGDDPEELAAARGWLEEQLHRSWMLDDEIDELQLALTEALTNLLRHGGTRDKSELRVQLEDQAVHLLIRDDSPPFEPGVSADPEREGGFGLLLLNMLTDEVDVSPGETGGSVLRLTKHRPTGS